MHFPHTSYEYLRDACYCYLVKLLTFQFDDVSLLDKKLKVFACEVDEISNGYQNVKFRAASCIGSLRISSPLPSNRYLTTEVEPSNSCDIMHEIYFFCDNCGS